ncbi:MAG: hypothetical protein ACREGC_00090 [Minisyncoccia bacterium]
MTNDVMPPDFVFLVPRRPLGQMRAWETYYGFKHFTFPEKGGFHAHYHARPQPNKGMPYSEATEANNIMKRIAIGAVMCLKPTLHPLKNIQYQIRRLVDYIYAPHYFHYRYYNDCSRELFGFTYRLLRKVGWNFDLSYWCGRIPATLFEYENSYRFRWEDLASVTSKEKLLRDPRGELKRIAEIYIERDLSHGENSVSDKFLMAFKILRFLLLIPKFKTAFKFALVDSEFKNFQLDEIESYWADRFSDYNYGGVPQKIRQLKQGFKLLC